MAGEVVGNLGTGAVKNQHINAAAAIEASKLATRTLQIFPQKLTDLRVWDAMATNLPATGGTDDLGLYTQTLGTTPPQVQTGDVKALGTTTRYARMIITVPDNYVAGGGLQIRCVGGMKTTVSDGAATVDVEAYLLSDDGSVSADLCSTVAQSIKSLTLGNDDFVLDPTNVVAGSRLDVRVTITVVDAATATAVIGLIQSLVLRCDVQP